MEIMRKPLQPAEIKRRAVCVPKNEQHLFPSVGSKLAVRDDQTGSMYEAVVGSQYRLQMPTWYDQHSGIQAGDLVVFQQDNGVVSVSVVPKAAAKLNMLERRDGKLSILEGKVLDLIIDALAGIEERGIPAKVRVGQNGILIEWGSHIKDTEITLGNTQVTM